MKQLANMETIKNDFFKLTVRETMLHESMRNLIVSVLKKYDGRISLNVDDFYDKEGECYDFSNFPVVTSLTGRYRNQEIAITDIYLSADDSIFVYGFDIETERMETDIFAPPHLYSFLLVFLASVFDWNNDTECFAIVCDMKSEIGGLSSELAEKELTDTLKILPGQMTENENYTEEIQEKFNPIYDKYEEVLFDLIGFDYHYLFQHFHPTKNKR